MILMKNLLRSNTLFHLICKLDLNCCIVFTSFLMRNVLFQEYLLQEELKIALEEEERAQLEEEKLLAEANMRRQEEAKRLRLEEEKCAQMEAEKEEKRKTFMASEHYKNYLARRQPFKMENVLVAVSESNNAKVKWHRIKKHRPNVNHPHIAELLTRVQPWVEVVNFF